MSSPKLILKSMVKRILNEEIEKRSATGTEIYSRLPEVTHDKDYKEIVPHKNQKLSKDELLDEMDKIVKGINKDYMVVWDDHDDISITAQGIFRIRVIPKWENNFCIEAFTHNEDRVYITGQSWEQVKNFVKVNLKEPETHADKLYKKSIDNDLSDKDSNPGKGMPQDDKPKTLPTTNKPFPTSKNKDKNYAVDDVKKEKDLPEKPMYESGEFKRQSEYKVKDPVKIRKKPDNGKHVVKSN